MKTYKEFYEERNGTSDWAISGYEPMKSVNQRMFDTMAEYIDWYLANHATEKSVVK